MKIKKFKDFVNEAKMDVDTIVSDIKDGYGWAGAEYIINTFDLPAKEMKELLITLADKGMLYDEDKVKDLESEKRPDKSAQMSKKDAEDIIKSML